MWSELCELLNAYIKPQVLESCVDLGLFDYLDGSPDATRQQIAGALGIDEHGVRVLLLGACTARLVLRDPDTGTYRNAPVAATYLTSGAESSMLPFVRFNAEVQRRGCSRLTESLRTRRNAGLDEFPGRGTTLYERFEEYPQLQAVFQAAMNAYTASAPGMHDTIDFNGVRQLLDVGGGDGSTAIRLCRRLPDLSVTVIEKPAITALVERNVADAGLRDRVRSVATDMFTDAWPNGHDAILLSHVLEVFSEARARELYRKAYECLSEDGRLFVWSIMANDTETGGLQAAKSSVYFLTTASGEGMAHPGASHESWAMEAGFRDVKRLLAEPSGHAALIARR